MTGTEIKKAFEQFKRELKKETGIYGGFTMSAKQIINRTATYLVCNLIPYESEIKCRMSSIERVSGFKSWTAEEKERSIKSTQESIKRIEDEIAKYGTKEAFAKEMVGQVVNSKAFAKFSEALGGVRYNTETKRDGGLDLIYLRFNY